MNSNSQPSDFPGDYGSDDYRSDAGAPYGQQPFLGGGPAYGAPGVSGPVPGPGPGPGFGTGPGGYPGAQQPTDAYGYPMGRPAAGAQGYDDPWMAAALGPNYQHPTYPAAMPSQPYGPVPAASRKEPALSLVLSFFLPGLGTMVNGQVGKGFGILGGYFLGALLSVILIGLPIMFGFWVWGMVDAYSGAKEHNARHGYY